MLRLVDDLLDASRIARGKVEITRQPLDFGRRGRLTRSRWWSAAAPAARASYLTWRRWRRTSGCFGDSDRLAQVAAEPAPQCGEVQRRGEPHWAVRYPRGARRAPDGARPRDRHREGSARRHLRAVRPGASRHSIALRVNSGSVWLIARALVEPPRRDRRGAERRSRDEKHASCNTVARGRACPRWRFPGRTSRKLAPGVPASTEQRCVLVVDDNADAADTLADALTVLLGYAPVTASDGPEALALVDRDAPVDRAARHRLAWHGQFTSSPIVRCAPWATRHGLKLVALTGYGLTADRERALAAGFDEHLVKPASLQVIQKGHPSDWSMPPRSRQERALDAPAKASRSS